MKMSDRLCTLSSSSAQAPGSYPETSYHGAFQGSSSYPGPMSPAHYGAMPPTNFTPASKFPDVTRPPPTPAKGHRGQGQGLGEGGRGLLDAQMRAQVVLQQEVVAPSRATLKRKLEQGGYPATAKKS